jgi:hypothetical protein
MSAYLTLVTTGLRKSRHWVWLYLTMAGTVDRESRCTRHGLAGRWGLVAHFPVRRFDDTEGTAAVDLDLILEARVLDDALGDIELLAGHIRHDRVLVRPTA